MANFWKSSSCFQTNPKHGVSFDEAAEVFNDPLAVIIPDRRHSLHEERFTITGFSSRRLLFVVFVEQEEGFYRIISARRATKAEKKKYEKGE